MTTKNKVLSVSKEIHEAMKKEAALTNQQMQELTEKLLKEYLLKSCHAAVRECLTKT